MNKLKIWNKEAKRVGKITDRLGKPIDKGIKDMVIVLNLLGFKTAFSCEGHAHRALPYPWVRIDGPQDKRKNVVIKKMEDLLEEFYSSMNLFRDTDAFVSMVLCGTEGDFKLQGQGSTLLDQLPKEILTRQVRAKILKRYQAEMDLFCQFLKDKFFKQPPQ